jgi:hypothetical protein
MRALCGLRDLQFFDVQVLWEKFVPLRKIQFRDVVRLPSLKIVT